MEPKRSDCKMQGKQKAGQRSKQKSKKVLLDWLQRMLYILEERRIDIKLYQVNGTCVPHLIVTFEDDYPDWSDSVTQRSFLG
jgi:hypothetical protein